MSLRYDDLRSFAESRFQRMFAVDHPSVPVQFGNTPIKQPLNTPWSRFLIKSSNGFSVSIARKFYERTPGYLEIQAFVPESQGDAVARKLCETGASYFEYGDFQTASGYLRFIKVRPPDDLGSANGFLRYASRVFFEYDVLKERQSA